jgi:hypothetical protein
MEERKSENVKRKMYSEDKKYGAHTKRRFTKRRITKRRITKRRLTKRRQDKTSTLQNVDCNKRSTLQNVDMI